MSYSFDTGNGFGRPTAGIEFGAVAAFAAAWESADRPPEIVDYLPDADTLRRGALVELIRIDLRHRWLRRAGGQGGPVRKRLLEYCSEFPELTPDRIPAGLVYEEFVIRRHSGERVDPRECLREFPAQATQLREMLNADDEEQSTRRAAADLTAPELTATVAPATSIWTGDATRTTTGLAESVDTEGLDDIQVGQRIDDFDLLTGLGSGAFARVFLARQRALQRLVAVKISADRGTEPQTLAQLDHDYIVRVFDQRLLDDPRGNSASRRLRLLYMQFLPGGTLLGVLRWVRATPAAQRSGQLLLDAVDAAMEEKGEIRPTDSSVRAELATLSWPETVAWLGRRLAEALAYADAQGVLHRDIKPANVLLTAEAVPKLADFNISFSRNLEGTSPVAYFGGSLSYMSPEQLEACHPGYQRSPDDLDTRSDIYSLGVVLWELLTGAKPFDDTTASEHGDISTLKQMLAQRHAGVDPEALRRIPPDCPAALRRVLLACLESDRDRRWADGTELAQQLELCLDERARDLVDPPPHSWRLRLRPWRVPVLALAIGLPNVIASLYNIEHNRMLIIDRLSVPAQDTFMTVTTAVNAIFFPVGIAALVYLSRCLITVPTGLRKGRTYDSATIARARDAALRMGDRTVLVVFSLWALSAVTFPVAMQLATGEVTPRVLVHFLWSLLICGAMAVAYPFFLVTFFMVRSIYPIFLRQGEIGAVDAVRLRRLDRRCTGYLAVTASVPLLAVAGVTFLPPADIPSVIVAVRVLCVGAIIAFLIAYVLFRALEADLRALERVVDPAALGRGADSSPRAER
ncbi:serine/threonine protein kinase [Nocardia sp. CDC159]|uniref:Serine/threonine protein kinase n=1 Tax=Nocardia pulmonis TaxID=2951408 RepID=A0A9X2E2A4_9NOCA|nr:MULTISPECIES: serine/threonine-protein kinase [Nocardia]MCM6772787.1 serine/threonine protein kinase [Nocardia pulmonis]MCM6785910.1 serine/threonine protein kinase [Nocardia sp. CDC159]